MSEQNIIDCKSTDCPGVPSANKIAMDAVTSSQIAAIGHNPETNTLAIQFHGKDDAPGSVYHYANVTPEQFAEFKASESIGSHFYKTIKPNKDKHPYIRIS